VGPDNRAGARAVGRAVAARLKKGDPIAILEGAPNAFNGIERTRGFQDAAHEAGLVIVRSQTANWETARASQVVSALVAEQPGVKAILCGNDSMALGAIAALKGAGRQGTVLVAGFDNISAVHALLMTGEIVATADQHGDQLAVYGIEYALQHLKSPGAALPDHETRVDLITDDRVQ
jgi:ribose transport system substrate-binding protein